MEKEALSLWCCKVTLHLVPSNLCVHPQFQVPGIVQGCFLVSFSSLCCKCLYKNNKHGQRTQAESYSDLFSIVLQQSLFYTYKPLHDVWRDFGNNLPKIFALQTYMLLKERGGIQVSPLALSTCLLLTCWERLGKRSSCFAWNGVQSHTSLICQNSNSFWRTN